MAQLNEQDDHESWLTWAIELMRRGIKPAGAIAVYGPLAGSPFCRWGEAAGWYIDGSGVEVVFSAVLDRDSKYDVRQVWLKDKEGTRSFTILPASKLPIDWFAELRRMKSERNQLKRMENGREENQL